MRAATTSSASTSVATSIPTLVQAEIEANGGRVVHREAGTGLAPFRTEDPHVCRIVATWSE